MNKETIKDLIQRKFSFKNVISCPICNKNKNTNKWTTNLNSSIDSYECSKCDIVFADKILTDQSSKEFYYGYSNTKARLDTHDARKKCYTNDMTFINNYCDSFGNQILDYGCGSGDFLTLFDSKKNRIGFDIDENQIVENRKIHKDISFLSDLNNLDSKNKFDMIIFRGSFQYIRDLNEIIKFIDQNLNDDGYLIILSLPNKNSPLASIQKENWSLYDPIEMFNIFSLEAISKLFKKYNILKTEFPYLYSPYSNEKEDLLNFLDVVKFNKQVKFPFWGSLINIIFRK